MLWKALNKPSWRVRTSSVKLSGWLFIAGLEPNRSLSTARCGKMSSDLRDPSKEAIMRKAITKVEIALLREASEMFIETGCVPGVDGEQVAAERMVLDVKEYISETIDNPETPYDPEIWDTPGFTLVLSWLAQKWNQRCLKLVPGGSKDPQQYLTKEQQEACLDFGHG